MVVAAAGAHEALCQFHRLRPDVVVSDLSMPDEDGCWLARHVRAAAGTTGRRLSAVALTANHDQRAHRRCFAAGFDIVLTKPVDLTEFCTVIERLVRAERPS